MESCFQLLIITEIALDRKSGVEVINMASKYAGYSVEFIVMPWHNKTDKEYLGSQ